MSKGSKEALAAIGLGEKTLCMPIGGTARDLHQVLVDTFPPLSSCGGYTLLRCTGKTKTLEIINPPLGGHTPMSLSSVVGQSRIYVRPLQRDIMSPQVGGMRVSTAMFIDSYSNRALIVIIGTTREMFEVWGDVWP